MNEKTKFGLLFLLGVALGVVLTAAYVLLLRHQPELLPLVVGTIAILSALKGALRQTYPAMLPGALVASVLVAIAAWVWFSRVSVPDVEAGVSPPRRGGVAATQGEVAR